MSSLCLTSLFQIPLTKWKRATGLIWLGAGVSVHTHVLTHTCTHTKNTHQTRTRYPHMHAHTPIFTYRWCSALRSSPGDTGTFRPCRFRVWYRAGYTHAGHSRHQSSPPHSDKLRPYTPHGFHSQLNTPLREAKEIWDTNIMPGVKTVSFFAGFFFFFVVFGHMCFLTPWRC